MQVVVKNLNYTYSKNSKSVAVKALKGINLTIEEGDFFGIIGETGSGKSTFIQHLNGLIKTTKEDCECLKIGEFDLTEKKCNYKKLRSKVGMVFQYPEYQLFAETVEADVMFGLKNCKPEMTEEEKSSAVKKALELVGLNYYEIKDKSPFELSGGQKRRVAIAGVLVLEPEVLILDEPAAGLDPKGKRELLKLLKEIHGKTVKTTVIVSHDMNLIMEECDKVALFHKGNVAKVDAPENIFKDKELVSLCGLKFPLTASLYHALKEKGVSLKTNLKVENFIKAVTEYYKGEQR